MGSKIVNLFFIIIGTICSLTFMKLTYEGFQQKLWLKHFSHPKLDKTDDAKLLLFFKLGLYIAVYIIALKILESILGLFERCKKYTATVQRTLLNSYEYFLIVFLILFYLIRSKPSFNVKQKLPLFGLWFITSRVVYFIGYILTTLTGLNFKTFGVTLTYFTIALMISEAFSFDAFKFFDQIPIPSLNEL